MKMEKCKLWGDPHVITFDGSRAVFYSEGDFWLIKSDSLKIQGRFQATSWTRQHDGTDYSSMTAIVVTGGMLDEHKLTVEDASGRITCDQHEILQGFGESICGPAQVSFDSQGELVDDAMAFLPHMVVHIKLPGGGSIQVNRWPNFINAMITSTKMPGGQDGVCGNFNGNADDDAGAQLHERFGQGVQRSEDLFPSYLPLHVPTAKPSPKRCKSDQLAQFESKCLGRISAAKGWSLAECMGDYCDPETSLDAKEMKDALLR